jgi:hypothetical protein
MIAKASFFIGVFPRAMDGRTIRMGHDGALVPKSHSGHVSVGRAGSMITIGGNRDFSWLQTANSCATACCPAEFRWLFSTEVTPSHSANHRARVRADAIAPPNRFC